MSRRERASQRLTAHYLREMDTGAGPGPSKAEVARARARLPALVALAAVALLFAALVVVER